MTPVENDSPQGAPAGVSWPHPIPHPPEKCNCAGTHCHPCRLRLPALVRFQCRKQAARMPSLRGSLRYLPGALWLLLPADQFPEVFTPHIHRFLGLPGWFLSPKSSGCWNIGSKSHASSRSFFPLSCFPCKTIEKWWEDQLKKTPSEEVLNLPHQELISQQPPHSKHFPYASLGQAPSKLDHRALALEGTAGMNKCNSQHISPRAGLARKVTAAGGRGICVRVKSEGDSCTGWKVRHWRIPRVLSTPKI